MKDILIANVTVLTMNQRMEVFRQGYVRIRGGKILETGAGLPEDMDTCEVHDGKGGILMPGMVNSHTHTGMIPFRSLGDDCKDRLRRFLFPMEISCMTPELVYHSARYAIGEMLLDGITTFCDYYYFEDQVAKAADEMGCRALLGETVMPFSTCDSDKPYGGVEYCRSYLPKWKGHERIIPFISPYFTDCVDDGLVDAVKELSQQYDLPVSFHLEEMDYEMDFYKSAFGKTPAAYLAGRGLMNGRMIAAHCIKANREDMELFARNGVSVAHCIGANTKAAKGVAPVKEMLSKGITVGLGTDGPSSGNTLDLFTQMKLFANFHKSENHDRSAFPAAEIVRLATAGGAGALKLGDKIGSIEPGKQADLVLIETKSPNMFPIFDEYSALVYSAGPRNVDSVYVDGKRLVKDGRLTFVDFETLRENLEREMGQFRREAVERRDSL